MPRVETDIKTTSNGKVTTQLGPYLIYYFRFAETGERIEERYLAVDDRPECYPTIYLDVDTKAANWVLEAVPNTHNQFYIYKARTQSDKEYQVLKPTKREVGGYILMIDSVKTLEGATIWTVEQGDRRNKHKFSTVFAKQSATAFYWVVTKEEDKHVVVVRAAGDHAREAEFALEEINLWQ